MVEMKNATLHDREQRRQRIAKTVPVVVHKIPLNKVDEYVQQVLQHKQDHQQPLLEALSAGK